MDKFIKSCDKHIIYINQSVVDGDTAIVLLHGISEHSGRYADFIEKLNQANISTFAFDMRGHGKSEKKNGQVKSLKKLQQDIYCVLTYIKDNFNFKKIGLFGHSAGGGLMALYACNHIVDFLVLSSPVVYIPQKLKFIKYFPYKILPFIKFKKKYSESSTMLKASYSDPLSCTKISAKSYGILLYECPKELNKQKQNITCPTLLAYGGKDILLNEQENFEYFIKPLTNSQNKLTCYKDANHRIVNNAGSEERIQDIINWLKSLN